MSTGVTYKIVICGDFAVGKTTFVRTFLDEDKALLEGYKPTIGVDIGRKIFTLNSKELIFQIWDLSGQKSFETIRPQFYNRTDGLTLLGGSPFLTFLLGLKKFGTKQGKFLLY